MAIEYTSPIPATIHKRGGTGEAQAPVCAVEVSTTDLLGLNRKIAGTPADFVTTPPTDFWSTGKKEIRLYWRETFVEVATFSRYAGKERVEVHVPIDEALDKYFRDGGDERVAVVLGFLGDRLREIRVRDRT